MAFQFDVCELIENIDIVLHNYTEQKTLKTEICEEKLINFSKDMERVSFQHSYTQLGVHQIVPPEKLKKDWLPCLCGEFRCSLCMSGYHR